MAWHWDCCTPGDKDDIIRAIRVQEGSGKTRRTLEEDEVTDFLCGSCLKGSDCMFCFKETVKPMQLVKKTQAETQERAKSADQSNGPNTESSDKGSELVGVGTSPSISPNIRPLAFRCRECLRSAHYDCLPPPPGFLGEAEAVIPHYQDNWTCADCATFTHDVESLLAWRHHPENISHPAGEKVNYRAYLPREYLVKWRGRGYNRCQWVPHSWLLFKSRSILQRFVDDGSRIPLLEKHISPETTQRSSESSRAGSVSTGLADEDVVPEGETGEASDDVWQASFKADPLAERRIPPGWTRTDRVLDAMFWKPKLKGSKKTKRSQRIRQLVIESDEDSDDATETFVNEDPELVEQRLAAQDEGIEPDRKLLENMEERVGRTKGEITETDIEDVAWVYIKWDELPHDCCKLSVNSRTPVHSQVMSSYLGCSPYKIIERMETFSERFSKIRERTAGLPVPSR
jgi:chromodomain-helicase-DNA-binding protein 4